MSLTSQLARLNDNMEVFNDNFDTFNQLLAKLIEVIAPAEIVGITVVPDVPFPRSVPMGTVKLVKKSAGLKAAAPGGKRKDGDFVLQDNQDDTFTVMGVDQAGAVIDISSVATIAVTSDNTAAFTVDPPTGMTFAGHGVAPGSAKVTIVATWNDSSIGPFTIDLPVTVSQSAATGITVTPGTPTTR